MGRNFALKSNQVVEAMALYAKGYSISKIALAYEVSDCAVKNALRAHGVQLRSIRQHYAANPVTLEKIRLNCIVDANGCWIWQGHVRENGYCRTTVRRRSVYVHRLVHELTKGRTPRHLDVCHECDNRQCCNPDHLFMGTRKTNMQDAKDKGRLSTGVLHSMAVRRGQARTGYQPGLAMKKHHQEKKAA